MNGLALGYQCACARPYLSYVQRVHLPGSPDERDERGLFACGESGDVHLDRDRLESWQ